ncbi:hypothetical protein [Brevibacillus reuszeri]|uniref:hypothetical protein n=1 Tax=Brevibacillus reuszeri TaxID=54915 RepID=UPI001F1A3071|nr:hypothetical protein [Brevibacillus reuszeri]
MDQAIESDSLYEERLVREVKEITGLENPNSLAQLKSWLADNGLETSYGMSKKSKCLSC